MALSRYLFIELALACAISLGGSGGLFSAALAQASDKTAVQQPAQPAPLHTPPDPKYLAAMAEAKQLAHDRQYVFAMDKYKKANKIAGGKDRDSLNKLLELQMKFGQFKDAMAQPRFWSLLRQRQSRSRWRRASGAGQSSSKPGTRTNSTSCKLPTPH